MIITVTGEDTFAIAAALRQLVDAFVQKNGANGVTRADAESLSPGDLPDLLQGATLFSPTRLVILTNLAANKSLLEPLAEALTTASPDNTIVIAETTLDKRTKLYKFLKANSTFKEFVPPKPDALAKWAQTEATRLGGEINPSDAKYLVERVAGDQWRLSNEIGKLVDYRPKIDRPAIDTLVEPTPEGTAFEVLEAALHGNATAVRAQVEALRTQEDPYKFFGLLASQVFALAAIATAGTRPAEQIAADTGVHPFVVRKTVGTAKRLGQARVAQIADAVALTDAQLKSTGADPWDLLQLCLLKMAN